MLWNPPDQPRRSDKEVDVKNCPTKDDGCQEMEIPNNEPQRFMQRPLLGIGLVQYLLGNGILVAVLDIGKANGVERATSTFLMAK